MSISSDAVWVFDGQRTVVFGAGKYNGVVPAQRLEVVLQRCDGPFVRAEGQPGHRRPERSSVYFLPRRRGNLPRWEPVIPYVCS